MKNKQFETILYSTVGVVALLIILLGINFIAGRARQRIDLTAEKAHTLSKGTRDILQKLDSEIKIRYYVTQGEGMVRVGLNNYAQHIEDLLTEYRQASKGKISIQKLDPKPDSDAEESAKFDGIEGQMVSPTDRIYLGLVVELLDQRVPLPFLSPERERLLEYDLSRAISKVSHPTRPVVGVMSGMQVFGMPMNPMMMRMGQRGQEPWAFISELKNDFTVKEVSMGVDKIDDDIAVLLVVHPREISETAQYAIDQFILRGGKLVAFVDASPYFDQRSNPGNPMMQGPSPGSSLEKLFKAWGIDFDTSKVVADMTFSARNQQGLMPAVLSINSEGVNTDDVLTGQIDSLLIPFAGVFSGTPVSGLKETILLKTSTSSQLVDRFMAQMAGESIANDFKASGKQYPLAIRLSGKFKTAFPEGKPKGSEDPADTNKTATVAAPWLKESTSENSVILVGDSDMLNDQVSLDVQRMQQMQAMFGQKVLMPVNGNLTFVQSAVEQMGGDASLIGVRSRASLSRPFTRVKKMEAKAQENYRSQIKALEDSLQETQRKLSELQQTKEKGQQRFILSPEQQKELENFKKKQLETNKKLKELRKNLRQDIDSLENTLKWLNILGMPILVALSGIALAVVKRKRTAAQ